MMPDGSFVDLRLNRQDGDNQESFWPSFTDIMTVIVMIFMIAMVILLLRNIELVNQLRATMEAERAAMELAKTTGEEKESLAMRLIAAENDIAMLQMQLMRAQEQQQRQQQTIGQQADDLSRLQLTGQNLQLRNEQLQAEKFSLEQQLQLSQEDLAARQQTLEQLRGELTGARQQLASTAEQLSRSQLDVDRLTDQQQRTQAQLAALQSQFSDQGNALLEAQTASRKSQQALSGLQSDMSILQQKYNKLIRPARSPAGRFLVEVRYTKRDGRLGIDYRPEDRSDYRRVSQAQLESALDALKQTHANGLYVKLIFPEDSGLSFNEAWSFTSRLHSRYDYYFQETASPNELPEPADE